MKRILSIFLVAAVGGLILWLYMSRRSVEIISHDDRAAPKKQKLPLQAPTGPDANRPENEPSPPRDKAADDPTAALKGNVVVNLGKVEDIGRKAAEMLLQQGELAALNGTEPTSRTTEQKRRLLELERQQAAALGTLEEIEGFQDNADEYSRFFSSLLEKAANLDANQTRSVSDYMRSRSTAMIARKLNTANEPKDPQQEETWEERRDAFNEETAAGAAKLLPPGEAERIGFTSGFLELLERDFDKTE